MGKVIHCRDLGMDCDFVARGETLEEVLELGAKHGAEVHGFGELTPELVAQVKAAVREE